MNALRLFEWKVCGPLEGELWGIRTNKEMDILQGADIVKFIKSLRLRWYGRVERMKNRKMPQKLEQLQWKEQEKEEEYVQDGDTSLKRI